VERTFAAGCARPGFRRVHCSLQGNHAHLIVEAQDPGAIGRGMKAVRPHEPARRGQARLALAVNRVTEHSGPVLPECNHMRLVRTPKEVRNALRYVLLDARRHTGVAARRARRAVDDMLDRASSARWCDGWKLASGRVPGAEPDAAAHHSPPVARARTGLLRTGWRRHGVLDPADVPS